MNNTRRLSEVWNAGDRNAKKAAKPNVNAELECVDYHKGPNTSEYKIDAEGDVRWELNALKTELETIKKKLENINGKKRKL